MKWVNLIHVYSLCEDNLTKVVHAGIWQCTRWISNMMSELANALNAVHWHQDCLAALQNADNFSGVQNAKCNCFENKIQQILFVEFMISALDMMKALSKFFFSQTRNASFPVIQSSLESCTDGLELIRDNPTHGTLWYCNGTAEVTMLIRLAQCTLVGIDEHLYEESMESVIGVIIWPIPFELEKLSPLLDTQSWEKSSFWRVCLAMAYEAGK